MPRKDGTGPAGSGPRDGRGQRAGGKGPSMLKGKGAKSGGKKGECK